MQKHGCTDKGEGWLTESLVSCREKTGLLTSSDNIAKLADGESGDRDLGFGRKVDHPPASARKKKRF